MEVKYSKQRLHLTDVEWYKRAKFYLAAMARFVPLFEPWNSWISSCYFYFSISWNCEDTGISRRLCCFPSKMYNNAASNKLLCCTLLELLSCGSLQLAACFCYDCSSNTSTAPASAAVIAALFSCILLLLLLILHKLGRAADQQQQQQQQQLTIT